MRLRRIISAGVPIALCLMAPLAAGAGERCARAGSDCRDLPGALVAPAGGWSNWAAGARLRMGGWTAGPAYGAGDATSVPAGADPMPAAARLYPRAGYALGVPALDPGAVVGYASYRLSELVSVDLTAGSGRRLGLRAAGSDLQHALGGVPFAQAADRPSWSVALNASRQIGAFGIGGRIGYVDLRDHSDALLDPPILRPELERASLRRSFLGIDASYEIGRNWQLHGGAMLRRDEGRIGLALSPGASALSLADRDEREWGVGVRYYGWRNFRWNVEYLKTSGRELGSESLLFMGRFDF